MEYHFDPFTKILLIRPYYYGKGNVVLKITDETGRKCFEKDQIKSGESIRIKGLNSFVDYGLTFYEKPHGLSLQNDRELFHFSSRFNAFADFVGRYFRIKEVQLYQIVLGNFIR